MNQLYKCVINYLLRKNKNVSTKIRVKQMFFFFIYIYLKPEQTGYYSKKQNTMDSERTKEKKKKETSYISTKSHLTS